MNSPLKGLLRAQNWYCRGFFSLLSMSLLATALVLLPAAPSRADATISLDKQSLTSVLFGGKAQFSLTASNAGAEEQYNLSYKDVLPVGVTYVAGSTTPSNIGDPTIVVLTNPETLETQQVLLWRNISDLTSGSSQTITYRAATDPAKYPIGSQIVNSAQAFSSADPREVPTFDRSGNLVPGAQIASASDSATAEVIAIRVEKSSTASPENELLRGVNDHQSVYSLKVTNNTEGPTSQIVVTDYLPAGLEYLGCGGAFNSTVPEYAGASNVVGTFSGCTPATAVETVQSPQGLPAGVYTKVTWTLSQQLAAGESVTLKYAAGIPQRENTMNFGGTTPTAQSGHQAANLNNNTGASTRETATERSLTNRASVTAVFNEHSVSDSTSRTVTMEDLRILKSASPTQFVQDGIATYTLTVATSEYSNLSDLSIIDEVPAGLCPVDNTKNWTGTPGLEDCSPNAAYAPTNATITDVVANADGSYKVTMTPNATSLNANGTVTITYKARMRAFFDTNDTSPTSALDSFTNNVEITGTSTPRSAVNPPETDLVQVKDASAATIVGGTPTLRKLRMANTTPMSCSTNINDYSATNNDSGFAKGDRVCFWLQVTFPAGVDTRNAQLTDFLPPNVTLESYSYPTGLSTGVSVTPQTPSSYVTFSLGSGTPRVVDKGTVFNVVISGTVTKPVSNETSTSDRLTDNLAKFRYTNTANQSVSLRDSSEMKLAPPPPIELVKGVQRINATDVDVATAPGNVDGSTVRGDDLVTFRIDVANRSTTLNGNVATILAPDVWDVLPAGTSCAAITAISDGGQCFDQNNPSRPNVKGNTTASVIRWQLPTTYSLTTQQNRTLTYGMLIPSNVSVSTRFDNTAAVASYQTATNRVDQTIVSATHYPMNNIDQNVPAANETVPAATDTSWVITPDASVGKKITTTTGTAVTQGVIGYEFVYTVSVIVPARTTLYKGVLTDPMPTGIVKAGDATAAFSAAGTSPAAAALPSGVSVNASNGTLTFPAAGYTNASDTNQLFEVKIPARVDKISGNTHGVSRTNTATLASTQANGTTALPNRTATASITVIEPNPTLVKTRLPSGTVKGGDTITYTLTAGNGTGRPTLQDTVVIDCVPAGLTVGTVISSTGTQSTEAGPARGCAAGTTAIVWNIGAQTSAATSTLTYTASVESATVAGQSYINNATLTGSSLADGQNGSANEKIYTKSATSTVTAAGAAIIKTPPTSVPRIGDTGTWKLTVTLPASVQFYNARIVDALPTGVVPVSITADQVTCTGANPCLPTVGTLIASPNGQTVGWSLGDIPSAPTVRTVTVTYSARVIDTPTNVASVVRQNTATFGWELVSGPAKPNATTASTKTVNSNASITIAEPNVTVAKNASATTVAPGGTVNYTLTVSNNRTGGLNLSPAYNVTVTDTVPAGIVVNPASISASGQLTGVDGNGAGGLITWQLSAPLDAKGVTSLTYSAKLAPSASLTSAAQVNTATVAGYTSLPDGGRTYIGPSTTATVTPVFPSVSLDKSVSEDPTYLGRDTNFTVTATNTGGAPASNLTIKDTLPPNWTYKPNSATITIGSSTVSVEPVISTDGGKKVLTWTNVGTLQNNSQTLGVATLRYVASADNPGAIASPGVGLSVPHTNTVTATVSDATGASGNASGSYSRDTATASARIASADVKIAKDAVGTPVAGKDLDYTLTVSNAGPDTAIGPFSVVDTIPAGTTFKSATGSGWTCSQTLSTVMCARVTVGDTLSSNGSFAPITVTLGIPASTAGGTSFDNTATVGATTYDPNASNNTSTKRVTVTRSADLMVDKVLNGTAIPGSNASYTVLVSNLGLSDARAPIRVTDTLPAGTTFVSASGSLWDCSHSSGVVTCDRNTVLEAGRSASDINIVVAIPSHQTGSLSNQVEVSSPDPDPNMDNNTKTVTSPLAPTADLVLDKSSVDRFVAGEQGVYVFTVHNLGPSKAAGPVTINDPLPTGITFVSDDSDEWDCVVSAGTTLTCTNTAGLPPNTESTVRVTVNVASSVTNNLTNVARVASPTYDPNPSNNVDTDINGPRAVSSLTITKDHGRQVPVAGGNVDFSLYVKNRGPSDTSGPISVVDTLPAEMTYVSASGSGWSCSNEGQRVACVRSAGLTNQEDAPVITVTAHIAADAGTQTVANYATVSGPLTPQGPGTTTHDDVPISELADVQIVKTAADDTVVAGTDVTYTMTVTNDGPSVARNLAVTDPLPAGLTLTSVNAPAGWTCADGVVSCTTGTMAVGATATFTVTATVGSGVATGTTITNTAVVSASTPDPDSDNNSSSKPVSVTAEADLAITKTHTGGTIKAGTQTTFTVDVENRGPSDAVGDIVIRENLPAGMTFVSSTGPWDCKVSLARGVADQYLCTLLDNARVLAGTHAPQLKIVALVDQALEPADLDDGYLVNRVSVRSPTTDPDLDNNTASDPVEIEFSADLSITKTHTTPVRIGDTTTFTLDVANAGTSVARDVTVTDDVPASLTEVAATGTGWNCSVDQQTVKCSLVDPLGAGEHASPISVTAKVTPAAYPAVTNTAMVSATTPDPNPSNNESPDEVVVPAQVDLEIQKTHETAIDLDGIGTGLNLDGIEPGLLEGIDLDLPDVDLPDLTLTDWGVVGQEAVYVLTVKNNGPTSDPGPVTVRDTLPTGVTYVSSAGDNWDCSAQEQEVTCVLPGGLAADASSVIRLTVKLLPTAYPEVYNVATVTSNAEDLDPSNNQANDTMDVLPLFELTLNKELVSIDRQHAVWSISVANNGPNVAPLGSVGVVDVIPDDQLTLDTIDGTDWMCLSELAGCIYMNDLAPGATASVTVRTTIQEGVTGEILNNASLIGTEEIVSAKGFVPAQPVNPADPGDLPDTGAGQLVLILMGLLTLAAGGTLIARRRRL